MAEVRIGSEWVDDLERYLHGLASVTELASTRAAEYLHEQTVLQARQSERWADVADQIEVWSEDGRLVIGVRDSEFVSQAFEIEYGDEVTPPDPLFRTLTPTVEGMGKVMGQTFASFYGGSHGA